MRAGHRAKGIPRDLIWVPFDATIRIVYMKKKRRSKDYNSYIQSPAWRAKRAEKIILQGGSCEHCGTTGNLHVHHLSYVRLGREKMEDLQVLCKRCHSRLHCRAVRPRHVRGRGAMSWPRAPKQKKKPDAAQTRLDALYAERREARKAARLAA